MAQVTLDSTEYLLLLENKKLLEAAIEKEKAASKEIIDLHKIISEKEDAIKAERIKILEESQHQVVNRTVVETHEFFVSFRDLRQSDFQEIAKEIYEIPEKTKSVSVDRGYHSNLIMHILDRYLEKSKSVSEQTLETTYIGIDKFKQDLKKEMDAEVQHTLQANAERIKDLELQLKVASQGHPVEILKLNDAHQKELELCRESHTKVIENLEQSLKRQNIQFQEATTKACTILREGLHRNSIFQQRISKREILRIKEILNQ